MEIKVDRKLAEHVLPLLRGLKLSRDLDLAESALHAERDLLVQLGENGQEELPFTRRGRAAAGAR